MKAAFDVKPGSTYDDEITSRYHFPARRHYIEVARGAVGDWALFRESRRGGGRQAYVATARVTRVAPDPRRADHLYAYVSDFLAFPTPAPFMTAGRYAEAPLRDLAARSGAGQALQGRSIRPISEADFAAIVRAGLAETLAPENAVRLGLDFGDADLPPLDASGFEETAERRIEALLVNRKVRDAAFRQEVCRAYADRCAVTGLRIINGRGRAEAQAAHIKPVSAGGPDVVQNGLALSATVHWLFDRNLILIDEDWRLLVAHNRVPAELRALFRPEGERLWLPDDRKLWPHPAFVAHHRKRFAGVG